ncbi:NmrA family NAD(P)-binding protein [Nocardiopsis alba]|uniref:NmrA family NAD(P)-binding protein n=1 Tax=Nocardiopsis alba TaxID=53437 RepID=UPI0033FF1305
MKDTTLVVGATGNVGAQVRRLLVEAGRPVRALSRDVHPEEAGVEWVRGDLTAPETLIPTLDGVGAVFLVWPGLDTEYAREVAGILAERDAHVAYLSSAGIDDGRDEQADPINAMHAEVERALDESGAKATHLRCTSFAASLLEWADQIREGLVRDVFGEARRTLLHERDIAEVAVRVLGEGAHRGERLLLSGPTPLTQVEQVRIIADTLGTRVRFEEVPLDELRSHMRSEGWEDADIEGMITAYAAMVEAEQPVWDTVERITGHPPLGLDRWVLDHEADLR